MADAGRPPSVAVMPTDPTPPGSIPCLPSPVPPQLALLLDRVARTPHAFDLFHLLRQIDALCPERPRLGKSGGPGEGVLGCGREPTLGFAPAALAGLAPGNATRPPLLRTYLFGLFGPNGPLPLPLTEYVHSRTQHHNDPTAARFADLLHHRLATLFFRSW